MTVGVEGNPGELVPSRKVEVPMILRGQVIETDWVEHQGRGGSLTFWAPDARVHALRIPQPDPASLAELYDLSFDDILQFLAELGSRLDIGRNPHLQWARELTYVTASRTAPLVDSEFAGLPAMFDPARVREKVERTIGVDHLEGWVENVLANGNRVRVRAFGARTLHIIPGNGGGSAAQTIIRSAVTRSDSIIKTPSNNPFGAAAIGRTMVEMAPDHPITRHVAIAYWKGGDVETEAVICQPHHINKIVAWGGLASVKHVTRYVQPGLELISLDPKSSVSVVGLDGLDGQSLREAALRVAVDMGTGNQTPCSSTRVIYAVTAGRDDALERLQEFGRMVHEELLGLPPGLSTAPKSEDPDLRSHVEAARLEDDWYTVIGGEDSEGAVVISHLPDPVEFAGLLANRTVNLVPVESVDDVFEHFDTYTQTVGVFPEKLKADLIDRGPLFGVQRFVSLGYSSDHSGCAPHDGLELERRLCRWVVDQRAAPIKVAFAGDQRRVRHGALTPATLEAVRLAD